MLMNIYTQPPTYVWKASFQKDEWYFGIDDDVYRAILDWRQSLNGSEPESCGIILGEYRENSIWVRHFSKPSKFDRRTRYSYFRSADYVHIML